MDKINLLSRFNYNNIEGSPRCHLKSFFKLKETTRVALTAIAALISAMALTIAFPKTMLVAIIGFALVGAGMKAWENGFKEWLMPKVESCLLYQKKLFQKA